MFIPSLGGRETVKNLEYAPSPYPLPSRRGVKRVNILKYERNSLLLERLCPNEGKGPSFQRKRESRVFERG